MDQGKDLSSEEKLLRLIGDLKAVQEPDARALAQGEHLSPEGQGRGFRMDVLLEKLNAFLPRKITYGTLNLLLAFLIAGFAFFAARSFLRDNGGVENKFGHFVNSIEYRDVGVSMKSSVPSLGKYVSDTETNNPFHMLSAQRKEEALTVKSSDFALVGIVWSDEPQAIIEEVKTKKNYMVTRNEWVAEYKVSNISETSVSLISKNGDKLEVN